MASNEGQPTPKGMVEIKKIITKKAVVQEFVPAKKKKNKRRGR